MLKHDHAWIVFHCELARLPHSKLIEKIIELHSRFNYKLVGIEANSLGKAKSDSEPCSFELVLRERQSLEPHFSSGQLQFLDTWNQDYPELIDQLIQFPLAAHDDEPDALAGAVSLIKEYAKAQAAAKAQAKVLYPRAQ